MEGTTGIVRRVDELGRVVIPKEMRRTLRIKEGEEMEVCVYNNSQIVLKKYSAIKALKDFEQEYADAIFQVTGNNTLICDNDNIVACAADKNLYLSKQISPALEKLLQSRKSVYLYGTDVISVTGEKESGKDMAVAPILFKGDIIGGVVLISQKGAGECGRAIAEVAAEFLSKQF
ncbi:MAG: stage V sporulation T C-terminal domain-containing protein [Clostridia bacterium]|nr:stage V sporulation T C-terminal domain-containing protein [Clostridia bacterium]